MTGNYDVDYKHSHECSSKPSDVIAMARRFVFRAIDFAATSEIAKEATKPAADNEFTSFLSFDDIAMRSKVMSDTSIEIKKLIQLLSDV